MKEFTGIDGMAFLAALAYKERYYGMEHGEMIDEDEFRCLLYNT